MSWLPPLHRISRFIACAALSLLILPEPSHAAAPKSNAKKAQSVKKAVPKPVAEFKAPVDLIRISDLKMTPTLPKQGQSVKVKFTIKNESDKRLDVPYVLTAGTRTTGTIQSLGPGSTKTIRQTFTASAGTLSVSGVIDPRNTLKEESAVRNNNAATLRAQVVDNSAAEWNKWSASGASKFQSLLNLYRLHVSFEGTVTGPVLQINKATLNSGAKVSVLKAQLVAANIPADVAAAMASTFDQTLRAWASSYRATVPAYPAFAAWPGPLATPMPNVPFPLIVGASSASAFSPASIENRLKAALSPARRNASGANTAISAFSTTLGGFLSGWLPQQQVMNIMGSGPVPSFSPPLVPVGPVVGGSAKSVGVSLL